MLEPFNSCTPGTKYSIYPINVKKTDYMSIG